MLKAIIVDDEPAILDEIKDLLEATGVVKVAGAYSEPLKALEEASDLEPECAFIDIEMMGMSGIELAERLVSINPHIETVFVTAYNHYAAQAFEVNAVDYILKPVRAERIEKTLEKLSKRRAYSYGVNSINCTIRSFGNFEVSVGGQTIRWNRSKAKELFAYLLQLNGKSVSKYKLCDVLWPEFQQVQALAYLQTTIWMIRKKFREAGFGGIRIEYSDHRYFVKVENVEWDVMEFERYYEAFRKSGRAEESKKALGYYRGKYLEEEDWLWAYPDRERYSNLYSELAKYK